MLLTDVGGHTQNPLLSPYPCGYCVVGHVQLDLINANLLAVEDARSQRSSSTSGLEHLLMVVVVMVKSGGEEWL